ncbi:MULTISPECIES: transcriptional regulator [Leuconostoc]|uniref:transcriptional regulator n=1 Tax=Leuconostoc TaxID=1243 RepID=UPI002361182E|nr:MULTISPECIES: transcriptional regulator [Leuconostoc]MDI6522872.1 transcriptional regulator [Leuconostoc suionicum]
MTSQKKITENYLIKLRRRNGELNKTKIVTAQDIGISRKTWEPIINGNKKGVTLETYEKLEKWLNS